VQIEEAKTTILSLFEEDKGTANENLKQLLRKDTLRPKILSCDLF
jgi:hypothetical protein